MSAPSAPLQLAQRLAAKQDWHACRFLSCSVLPVRTACNCQCPFCFSKSSISTLRQEKTDWQQLDVKLYYRWAQERGANRLVVTGGGEPLLRSADVLGLVALARGVFNEVACFTNGTYLTPDLAKHLADAGLSYLCYSRHHEDDVICRQLMGQGAPRRADFLAAARAGNLKVRATCVMAKGYVETAEDVWRYINAFVALGVREFTFKHTYVAYDQSLYQRSAENAWAAEHQVESDPFAGQGIVLARLPWGPEIRRIGEVQVCHYREPTPDWELTHGLCRSSNLLADGNVYASLEDRQSLLYRLTPC